jgi:hypothetical protein
LTLELNKLTTQVDDMGRIMVNRRDDAQDRSARAHELLLEHAEVTEELERKIARAREVDEWRRGAIPMGKRLDETVAPGIAPDNYILIAADGSQIYPDRHAAATYFLLNTGTIVFRCGTGQAPTVSSTPQVFYADEELYDENGEVHGADYVSAQRNRLEIKALADLAEAERTALGGDVSVPIICVLDGPLLPWMRPNPENNQAINEEIDFFVHQLARLRKAGAIPVGYVDRPGSAYVLRILELIGLPIEKITRETLREGRFRQLADRMLFHGLRPAHRTGMFEPNSNTNDRYQHRSGGDRIAFVYANMAQQAGADNAGIARLEVPGWIAQDPAKLDIALLALYANCEPVPYPYVLARSHELAVVTQAEKADLETMLVQVMMRNGIMPAISFKSANKLLTSHRR